MRLAAVDGGTVFSLAERSAIVSPSAHMPLAVRVKPWIWKTAIPVIVVAGMVVAWFDANARARRELEKARAAFAAHGFPIRIEEMVPPSVPVDQNADPLLREAWNIITGSTTWEGTGPRGVFREMEEIELYPIPNPKESLRPKPDALAQLVRLATDPAVTAFAEQVHTASRRTIWRQDLDYNQGPALLLVPHLSPLRTMVRLLTKRAVALAQSPATVDAAWEDLLAAQTLADWASDVPILIAHLTGVACRGIVNVELLTVLESGGPPQELDATIARFLQSLAFSGPGFERAIHTERIFMFAIIDRYLASRSDWLHEFRQFGNMPRWVGWCDPWLTPVISPLARPRLAIEYRRSLDLHLAAALAIHQSSPAMVSRLRALAKEQNATLTILPDYFSPMLAKLSAMHFIAIARQRMLVVLLATIRHHATTATWPTTIAELSLPGDVGADPCSGEPLRLVVNDDTITVYAAGLDGDDDDGRALDPADFVNGDGDIVVRVRLPQRSTKAE